MLPASSVSLSPVPEDELVNSVSEWRTASTPHLVNPARWSSMSGRPDAGNKPQRPPPRSRPVSYPPAKEPIPTEYYAPSMRSAAETFYSPRGATNLRQSEYFYEPPPPGTVTVASSLSGIDMEDKQVWYRRKYMMLVYGAVLCTAIGAVVAVIIVFSR